MNEPDEAGSGEKQCFLLCLPTWADLWDDGNLGTDKFAAENMLTVFKIELFMCCGASGCAYCTLCAPWIPMRLDIAFCFKNIRP